MGFRVLVKCGVLRVFRELLQHGKGLGLRWLVPGWSSGLRRLHLKCLLCYVCYLLVETCSTPWLNEVGWVQIFSAR